MRISDWSSDVCSSDLLRQQPEQVHKPPRLFRTPASLISADSVRSSAPEILKTPARGPALTKHHSCAIIPLCCPHMLFSPLFACRNLKKLFHRSEEHTSELQSLMRISYAVFCLKKKKKN